MNYSSFLFGTILKAGLIKHTWGMLTITNNRI